MNSNPQHPHPNYRLFISILAMLAIGVWLVSVSLYKQKQQREEIPAIPITPAAEEVSPTVKQGRLELAQQRANPQVGQPFELTITANSEKKDVVGYDVLLEFDETAFTYVNAVSLVPSFSLVPVVRDGLVAITANKAPSVKTSTVFSNTDVIRVTFTAKKRGKTSFSVLPSSGNLRSRFVDANLGRLNPQTSTLEVEIK